MTKTAASRLQDTVDASVDHFGEDGVTSPRVAIMHFLNRLLHDAGRIVYDEPKEDPFSTPIFTDATSYAVSIEVLRPGRNPQYFAYGPLGTEPPIPAKSAEEARELAVARAHAKVGATTKILVREVWPI